MQKTAELLTKYITPKAVSIVLTLLYVASLIPLLLIARYSYPGADDFSIGETSRHAWTQTHNIFPVIWQAVRNAVDDYLNWMGCFSSVFFMSVQPGVFGEQWYFLTTWIMLGMVSLSTIYLFHAIMVKALKMNRYLCCSISMITLFVMVQCMVGRGEAFFWFNGAVHYIFHHSVGMFMLGGLISSVCDEKRGKRIWDLVLASVMGVLAGGGNYMTALDIGIILTAAGIVMVYRKQWKKYQNLWIPIGLYLAAFAASMLAPGNHLRSAGASGMNPIKAVLVSFYYALDYGLSDWTNWVVILMIIVLIPLFWKAAKQTQFTFPYPLIMAVFSYCLLSATITPPLFAVGNIMAGRLQALIFVVYILLLTLNVGYMTGWVQKKVEKGKQEDADRFTFHTVTVLLVCGAFLLFGSMLCMIPEPHYFTYTSAITDLTNGSAKEYGEAMKERARVLNHGQAEEKILLEPLPAQPALLYFGDMAAETGGWENRAMARYYGVASVAVKEK